MDENTQTRETILNAAIERIVHYGYAKTTMNEIAQDCAMSAGNVYRFFQSKLEIAEAIARRFANERFQTCQQIAHNKHLTAQKRLQSLFHFDLENTFSLLERDDKILDLAYYLRREQADFAESILAQERVYVSDILKDGIERGEFIQLKNINKTAEIIQCACMKFSYPQLWSHLELPALKEELDGVLDLILAGLSCESTSSP